MTAGELIARVDALRPNQYSADDKLGWLRRLDGQILAELEETHHPGPPTKPSGFVGEEEGQCHRSWRQSPDCRLTSWHCPDDGTRPSRFPGLCLTPELPDRYEAATPLLADFPFDEGLYSAWLFCQIDLHNGEIGQYNQSLSLFAAAWRQLADHINRHRRPLCCAGWRL